MYASVAWRGQAYLVWEQLRAVGQFLDIVLANLHDRLMDPGPDLESTVAGGGEAVEFDPLDAFTVATAEVQVIFGLPEAKARALVNQAIAAAERLSVTADLLRDGMISADMFAAVVARTAIVDSVEAMRAVDRDLAAALARAGHISVRKAESIADQVVARHDPEGVRRRRAKAAAKKNMTSRDLGDGLAGIFLTTDAEEARLCFEAVDALAKAVCPADRRSLRQRRSAAATARLRGQPFTCGCTDKTGCTAELPTAAAAESGEAGEPGGGLSARQARIVIHAICQKSTLDGDDEEPGWLDGHGVIGADHARELASRPDATVRELDLEVFTDPDQPVEEPLIVEAHTHQPADPYRPTTALDTLARALFQTCTIPGCERPAWHCELDHV
ncbi:hypothetical protein GOHSU_76_00010, partial [Gordonia hirsuta DSM 44140 = NBRC 16056]